MEHSDQKVTEWTNRIQLPEKTLKRIEEHLGTDSTLMYKIRNNWPSLYIDKEHAVWVTYGRLDLLKETHDNKEYISKDLCLFAAAYDQFEILKWLSTIHKLDREICNAACINGNLKMLKWARKNGCPWDFRVYLYAAIGGHEEILRWIYENGAPLSLYAYYMAIKNGNLKLLELMYKHGGSLDSSLCRMAAISGQLDILIWLRRHGCEWDRLICRYAKYHPEILRWLEQSGCPCGGEFHK